MFKRLRGYWQSPRDENHWEWKGLPEEVQEIILSRIDPVSSMSRSIFYVSKQFNENIKRLLPLSAACTTVALYNDSNWLLFLTPGGRMIRHHAIEGNCIPLLSDVRFTCVSIAKDFCVAVSRDGNAYAWGRCKHSWRGHAAHPRTIETPALFDNVSLQPKIVSVSAGVDHCIAVGADGEVYTWGNGVSGQCGVVAESIDGMSRPQRVRLGTETPPVSALSASAGDAYSLVVMEDGALYAFGKTPGSQYDEAPHKMAFDIHIVSAAAGRGHALALTQGGNVYAWGDNSMGQLGNGMRPRESDVPTHVDFREATVGSMSPVSIRAVTASDDSSGALADDGRIFWWGQKCCLDMGEDKSHEVYASGYDRPKDVSCIFHQSSLALTSISMNAQIFTATASDGTVLVYPYTTLPYSQSQSKRSSQYKLLKGAHMFGECGKCADGVLQ